MIERKFVAQKLKEYQIQEFIADNLKRVGHSHTKMVKTPLGEKIIIYASRPGLIVGKKGQNIKKLTKTLKRKFDLENPQIEISEVENIHFDAQIVAERISNSLEKFGISRFKGVGHKVMSDVLGAGALGIEIIMSGKIPSTRAKRWRFYQGYLKKCGDIAQTGVSKAYSTAKLKTGIIGVQVRIMPPDIELPDKVEILKDVVLEEGPVEAKTGKENQKDEKKPRKRTPKKKAEKSESHEQSSGVPKQSFVTKDKEKQEIPADTAKSSEGKEASE